MPELAEIEAYRRLAEDRGLLRPIGAVTAPDGWYLKAGLTAAAASAALVGRHLLEANRVGKVLLLATSDDGPVLALRFGMSGRLVVDDRPGVEELWYASNRNEARWERFALEFTDGGRLLMRDPRRLGGVTLDPPLDRLGPDALTITLGELRRALAPGRRSRGFVGSASSGPSATPGGSPADPSGPSATPGGSHADPSGPSATPGGSPADPSGPSATPGGSPADPPADSAADAPGARGSRMSLKGRLMDQSRVAGVGNLAADEILWRAGLDPTRPASSLTEAELRRLHRNVRSTLRDLLARGGSHTGELMPQRHHGGHCPKDGTPLVRATVATRTTWWCPKHQH
jgi:formamidopyrimidine-DNA glycosylase